MVRSSSRSRSRGRGETADTVSPPKPSSPSSPVPPVSVSESSAHKFLVGSPVLGRWPGSKLFYTGEVISVQGDRETHQEYQVRFQNGSVFTLPAKDVYGQNSLAFRRAGAARSKSKSRARSKGRGKKCGVRPKQTQDSEASIALQDSTTETSQTEESVQPSVQDVSPVSVVSNRTKPLKASSKSSASLPHDETSHQAVVGASPRLSHSSQAPQQNGSNHRQMDTIHMETLDQDQLSLRPTKDRPSFTSNISSLLFGTTNPAQSGIPPMHSSPNVVSLAAMSEDEADDLPSPTKVSVDSKKWSRTSRASVTSRKTSANSKLVLNTEEEDNDISQVNSPDDITLNVDLFNHETVSGRTSISSRISNILFGEASKASTSSKIGLEEVKEMSVESVTTENGSYVSTRQSKRISMKSSSDPPVSNTDLKYKSRCSLGLDEFSDDEEKPENGGQTVTQEKTEWTENGGDTGERMECVWAVCFMLVCPGILVWLHTVCTADICNLQLPSLSLDPRDYWDGEAVCMLLSFILFLRLLEFLCLGKQVQGHRMNGFQSLVLVLLLVPVLVYHGYPLTTVTSKYFYLLTSAILVSYLQSILSLCLSYSVDPTQLSTKGNTNNILVNMFHGRELNPVLCGANVKLQTFRYSMIGLAVLNTVLVWDSSLGRTLTPTVILAAAFQILYCMDAMYYEECYFYSHDSLHSGYGWSLISSYLTFPFLPTLVTRHLVTASPDLPLPVLASITATNLLGYWIYRSSENQRCQLARDPSHPSLSHLNTLETIKGRRLIVSGWWSLVRHPNYLGELLIQWSWVLPAVPSLGISQLVPYYLPAVTTLMLILRCLQINKRNSRKFGFAWTEYTGRVKSNIVPLVF